jgi:hypothetical protein
MERIRYYHIWEDDETGVDCEFDVLIETAKDSLTEPGYTDIVDGEFNIDGKGVSYNEFVENTHFDIWDMANDRFRSDF